MSEEDKRKVLSPPSKVRIRQNNDSFIPLIISEFGGNRNGFRRFNLRNTFTIETRY